MSSSGHQLSDVDLDDPHFERREYDKWVSYGQSKTANALFSVALSARYAKDGIISNAVHPGGIRTQLIRHMTDADLAAIVDMTRGDEEVALKSIQQGAATSIWAAVTPELEGRGGLYLQDCAIVELSVGKGEQGYRAYARNPAQAEALWRWSERVLAPWLDRT